MVVLLSAVQVEVTAHWHVVVLKWPPIIWRRPVRMMLAVYMFYEGLVW